MINITVSPTTRDPKRQIVYVHVSNVIMAWSKALTNFKLAINDIRLAGHQIAEFHVSIARTLTQKQINDLALIMRDSKVILKDSIMELPPDALIPISFKIAQAKLDQVMAEQQDSDKIRLPPHIRYCTPLMLHKAWRKFRGTVHLHKDTHSCFGIVVAKALSNSMALMLSDHDMSVNAFYFGNKVDAARATLCELKPGNKLYVEKLTDVLCRSIPVLKPQVTLLLNIETMTQQDAITMIKLLPPGCILGLAVSQAQHHHEEMQATYQQCALHLPKSCILRVTADMDLAFILSLNRFLFDGTALLVPKILLSATDDTWLADIAHIASTSVSQLMVNENDIAALRDDSSLYPTENTSPAIPDEWADRVTGIADMIQRTFDTIVTRTLILPPGISRPAVDYLIDHLPVNLSIELPKGLFLSAEQWSKLARPGIKVSGTLGFPEDMSKEDVDAIMQRLEPLPPTLSPVPSTTLSDNQESLFAKRSTSEPGTMLSREPSAKRQHTNAPDPRFDRDSRFYQGEPVDISQHALIDDQDIKFVNEWIIGGVSP